MAFEVTGKSIVVTFSAGCGPLEASEDEHAEDNFCRDLDNIVTQVPAEEYISVLGSANARTGKREEGEGGQGSKVLGPYGWDVLRDTGLRLLTFVGENV